MKIIEAASLAHKKVMQSNELISNKMRGKVVQNRYIAAQSPRHRYNCRPPNKFANLENRVEKISELPMDQSEA